MTKKERLGSDPFKGSSLDWIHDTREEKKEPKEIKKQKPEEVKPKDVKTLKRQNVKVLKRQNVKTSKRQNVLTSSKDKVKKTEPKRRHTVYLTSCQSKKLKLYAAKHDMQLSEVIEKLINDNI
jgi:phosphatidate phosphatase PAH1